MSVKEEKPLEHEYDGIQELDNPLPGWWLATFYGAIVFSVLYVGYYHFGPGPGTFEELARDLGELRRKELAMKEKDPGPSAPALLALLEDPARREAGRRAFTEKCASCHGPDGGGLIGPNLTDRHWLHGRGGILDIFHVVADGAPEKGMPPWKGMLKREELENVVAFAHSLKGTRPRSPKEPQGEEVKD